MLAGLSAVANFFFLPYYPLWAIVLIALDVWVIWALTRPVSWRPDRFDGCAGSLCGARPAGAAVMLRPRRRPCRFSSPVSVSPASDAGSPSSASTAAWTSISAAPRHSPVKRLTQRTAAASTAGSTASNISSKTCKRVGERDGGGELAGSAAEGREVVLGARAGRAAHG